jgi:hypothetical protein
MRSNKSEMNSEKFKCFNLIHGIVNFWEKQFDEFSAIEKVNFNYQRSKLV